MNVVSCELFFFPQKAGGQVKKATEALVKAAERSLVDNPEVDPFGVNVSFCYNSVCRHGVKYIKNSDKYK